MRRTEEMRAIQDVAVLAVASLAETRDNETGNHIRRTQYYVRTLAGYLQRPSALSAGARRQRRSSCCSNRRRCTTSARSAFPTASC